MCNFLSAIGLKNGDILCDPSIDSHEDLVALHELKETKLRNWVRIEFLPKDNKSYHLADDYILKINDDLTEWITDVLKEKWVKKLKAKLNRIIITKNIHCLSSGTYILSGKILVNNLLYSRIINAGHSTIMNAGHSTIRYAGHSTIRYAGHSTIENAGNSTIINK